MTKAANDLFAPFPLDGEQRQAVHAPLRAGLDEQAARAGSAWRLRPARRLPLSTSAPAMPILRTIRICAIPASCCSTPRAPICCRSAISPGHSYQSAQMIMKHYRARNAARADVAIDKLVAFIGKAARGDRIAAALHPLPPLHRPIFDAGPNFYALS